MAGAGAVGGRLNATKFRGLDLFWELSVVSFLMDG